MARLTVPTERQWRFVGYLRAGLGGKAAAERAGYSAAGAAQTASRLRRTPFVADTLAEPATNLERAAVAARERQQHALARMEHYDRLCTAAAVGNVRAQIAYLAAWRREQRRKAR